jgi:hypothetical protein
VNSAFIPLQFHLIPYDLVSRTEKAINETKIVTNSKAKLKP